MYRFKKLEISALFSYASTPFDYHSFIFCTFSNNILYFSENHIIFGIVVPLRFVLSRRFNHIPTILLPYLYHGFVILSSLFLFHSYSIPHHTEPLHTISSYTVYHHIPGILSTTYCQLPCISPSYITYLHIYPHIPSHAMLYHFMPYHVMPCHTVPYHSIPCHTMPYHTIPCHTIPYHTIPYHAISCHTMPYHAIPCHTMSYHAIPCHTMSYHDIPQVKSKAVAVALTVLLRPPPDLKTATSMNFLFVGNPVTPACHGYDCPYTPHNYSI